MKTKMTVICAMIAACAAFRLTAMPTEEEAKRAEPVVQKLMAGEKAALKSGRKTRSEVAQAALKLADEADTDAAKLLLMKGAFVLYVHDGNLEKAVETMKALETAIFDMPPASVTNMVEMALFGAPGNVDGTRLYKMRGESSTTETGRQAFERLFPGWQTSVGPSRESSHRGENDVVYVHPPSQETPAVVSRTMMLSNGNPCLFLKMASFDKGSDFLLSVLVNGKEIVPKRLICTPDNEPWRDITIPLFAWRGEEVRIEIVLTANNWWCEFPFFKRLEVAEGTGQEKLDIDAIGSETGIQKFARGFPGWEARGQVDISLSWRGEDNVALVHPVDPGTPSVVSRTVKLSGKNPRLRLTVSSFDKDHDFLLSVLVDGKEVQPKRLVRTPDTAPWEDIIVPLSDWKGRKVKIEVVVSANDWYCEHAFFKRLEVAEGSGKETVAGGSNAKAGEWTVAQYNGSSEITNLVEAQKIVDETPKVAEKTYRALSLANNDNKWGDFPHEEFPGTTAEENADYFAITATGSVCIPDEGDWTFACRSDDGFRFVISGNGLNDIFEDGGIRGLWEDPLTHTVHFPAAGIYSVTCLYFENEDNAGLEFSVARGSHDKFDPSLFKLIGNPERGEDHFKPIAKRGDL